MKSFLPAAHVCGAIGCLFLALLEQIVFAVEEIVALLDAALFRFDLFAPLAGFELPILAQTDELFLA